MGRGPKTKAIRTARKTAGATPSSDRWSPPSQLSEVAREAWIHLVGELREAGTLDRTDPTVVEAYAINVEVLRLAHLAIRRDGLVVDSPHGAKANPAVNAINCATIRLKGICYDLGLVPATSKYNATKGTDDATAEGWGDLLSITG